MGFLSTLTEFERRMGRFNGALDRHTNLGPTSYYMFEASPEDPDPQDVRMM